MVEKADIEAKAREIEQTLAETKESFQQTAVIVAVAVVTVIALAFLLGRRRGKGRAAIVEVYRI